MELATAYWPSRCLHIVAELSIADALDDRPQTAATLAEKTGADPKALHRVLRSLTNHGVFTLKDGKFAHNDASRMLRADAAISMKGMVALTGLPILWNGYRELGHSLRTGRPSIEAIVEGGIFAYFAAHPDEAQVFNEAMVAKTIAFVFPVIAAYDFKVFKTVADIGGGVGRLLSAVLDAAPGANGVLFELPQVIEQAKAFPHPRMALVSGDFFRDEIPPCDAYILANVLHDWSDDEAVAILNKIKSTAPASAKFLIMETVLQEQGTNDLMIDVDTEMLVLTTGRERTQIEWDEILEKGGLRMERCIDLGGHTAIMETVAG
jgi:hypothetical protein